MIDREPTPEQWRAIIEDLDRFKTTSDLREALGPTTPEEQTFMESIDLDSPLTAEELEVLGPDFTERLVSKVREGIRESLNPTEH